MIGYPYTSLQLQWGGRNGSLEPMVLMGRFNFYTNDYRKQFGRYVWQQMCFHNLLKEVHIIILALSKYALFFFNTN